MTGASVSVREILESLEGHLVCPRHGQKRTVADSDGHAPPLFPAVGLPSPMVCGGGGTWGSERPQWPACKQSAIQFSVCSERLQRNYVGWECIFIYY